MSPAEASPCHDVRALLPLFVGDDLEAPLAEQVRTHLGLDGGAPGTAAGCASCAQALEGLERVRAALLELPQRCAVPVVDVWPGVRQALAAEGHLRGAHEAGRASSPATRPAGRLLQWRRVASAAAAMALLALGAHLVLRGDGDAPGEPPPGSPTSIGASGLAGGSAVPQIGPSLPVAAPGGLRRLEPGEAPLHEDALPFAEWMRGWPQARPWPGVRGAGADPSRPTFASDRSLR